MLAVQSAAFAQKVDDTPVMQFWKGGRLDLSMSAFYGPFTGTGAGVMSPVFSSGIESISINPAVIALQKKAQVSFDLRPGLSNKTFGMSPDDLFSPEDIKDGTDDFLEDTATFKFPSKNFRQDTKVNDLSIGGSGGITAMGLTIPVYRGLTVGASFNPMMDISLNMFLGNVSTNLKSTKPVGDNSIEIDMILRPTIAMNASMRMNKTSFALGYSFLPEKKGILAAGLAFNRYQARNYIDLNINIDGMIVIENDPEFYFNDPNDINLKDDQTNDFFMRGRGDFKDTRWGYTFGAFFDPSGLVKGLSFLNLSLAVDIAPDFEMVDRNAKMESYQPLFLKGKITGNEDEQLDILIDAIDIDQPNRTRATDNEFTDTVKISLPSSFTAGMDLKLGSHILTLNYVSYFKEFSYQFGKYKLGKSAATGIKFGADFRMPDKLQGWSWALLPVRLLYLDFDGLIFQAFSKHTGYKDSHYRLAGGVMMGDALVEGFSDDDKESMTDALNMPMPVSFALSRKYTVYDKMTVGVTVFGFPDMFMKFSLGYAIN